MATPVTVKDVYNRLVGLDRWLDAAANSKAKYDEDTILETIASSIRKFCREVQMRIDAVQVVSVPDGTYDVGAVYPIYNEPAFPYQDSLGQEFMVTTLTQRPIITVQRVRVMLGPKDIVFSIPPDWFRWNAITGRFWMVPVRGTVSLSGGAASFAYILQQLANTSSLPTAVAFDYQAGFPTDWQADSTQSAEWSDLKRSLSEIAALQVLNDISHTFDAGINQKSMGADGATQQTAYSRFQDRKQELMESVASFRSTLMDQETPILMGFI